MEGDHREGLQKEVGVFILLLMSLLSIFILQKRTRDETVVATAVGVVYVSS
nr:hypothetical protein [Tanacetum cinerariifolium]